MSRLLPPSEWPRLAGTLLDPAWKTFSPSSDKIIAVEAAGVIVACISLSQQWHLEGLWVREDYRGRIGVGRRMLTTVRTLLRAMQIGCVQMMATNPRAARMCQRFGLAKPLPPHFEVAVRGTPLWADDRKRG